MEKSKIFYGLKFYRMKKGYFLRMFQKHKKNYGLYAHRYVWERHHGKIPPGAAIHHIDGDKSNNSIENLQLVASHAEHLKMHYADPVFLEKQRKQILALNKSKIGKKHQPRKTTLIY